jgi:microcystin-dependent protein
MDGIISEIRLYPGGHVPMDWLPCDGRELNIQDYTLLFEFAGFIPTSDNKFVLPTLSSPVPNMHYIICVAGTYIAFPN